MVTIKNTLKQRWIGLLFGLFFNASGNALSVAGHMGSGVWTASAVNISGWLGWPLGTLLFIIGTINAITNQFLIRRLDIIRLVGEMCFIVFFSTIVQFFTRWFAAIGVGELPVVVRVFISALGIFLFCIGISLYQRANIVMHPNDDTTNILRFLYVHGNATISQLIDFMPPIVAITIVFFNTGQIDSVNIATLFSILGNGFMIAWSDEHIWPTLKHNFRSNIVADL